MFPFCLESEVSGETNLALEALPRLLQTWADLPAVWRGPVSCARRGEGGKQEPSLFPAVGKQLIAFRYFEMKLLPWECFHIAPSMMNDG